jgi:DUF1680 family protein
MQQTKYPQVPETSIALALDKPAAFPVYVRVPAWAGEKTRISVNGKPFLAGAEPGKFATLQRTWENGDRIEIEFDMQATLEAADPQHPNLVAPVHGPLALFSVGSVPADLRGEDVLRMTQAAKGSEDWQAKTASGSLTLRPFTAIRDEHYRLYLALEA